jgi:hypothetical protein
MGDGSRRGSNTVLRAIAMDNDLGMAGLMNRRLQNKGRVVGIVASNCSSIVQFRDIRNHGEPGHAPALSISALLGELAG